jgi:hypothetical protein
MESIPAEYYTPTFLKAERFTEIFDLLSSNDVNVQNAVLQLISRNSSKLWRRATDAHCRRLCRLVMSDATSVNAAKAVIAAAYRIGNGYFIQEYAPRCAVGQDTPKNFIEFVVRKLNEPVDETHPLYMELLARSVLYRPPHRYGLVKKQEAKAVAIAKLFEQVPNVIDCLLRHPYDKFTGIVIANFCCSPQLISKFRRPDVLEMIANSMNNPENTRPDCTMYTALFFCDEPAFYERLNEVGYKHMNDAFCNKVGVFNYNLDLYVTHYLRLYYLNLVKQPYFQRIMTDATRKVIVAKMEQWAKIKDLELTAKQILERVDAGRLVDAYV